VLGEYEKTSRDLDRRVFAITRVFEHVRNRHHNEGGSRRSRFESTVDDAVGQVLDRFCITDAARVADSEGTAGL
jgi:hypothetical protein